MFYHGNKEYVEPERLEQYYNQYKAEAKSEIDEKYSKPKHKLVNDFIEKRISYDDYIQQFKDLGMKHHYYTLLVDKLEKMK